MALVEEIKNDLEIQKKINKELKRLNGIFKDMPAGKRDTVKSLVGSAAFMAVILNELEKHIAEHGTVSEYQNGANQWGTKKSPEVEVYNSMLKNHMGVIKQLTDLLDRNAVEEDDGFDAFLQKKDAE